MGKKKSTSTAAKAAKKAKAEKKAEKRTTKKGKKDKREEEESDDDLEAILEKMRQEWEAAHTVTEEVVEGPPSKRANATMTACPSGNYLWYIGGEYFSEDGRAYFYNEIFRYTPEKDEWRTFISPTCPGPRSAHAVATTHNKIFLFGGEFSSLHQTTFHHYRDFWCFDINNHDWERIETKVTPSARSGPRMAVWKHYIVLFGGFYDPGITTKYHNDLWLFDTHEYKWRQIEFRENDAKPSPRSGFSFLPTSDGIVLHGGYCKEYAKGKRPVGVMLDDTWFLSLSLPTIDTTDPKSPTATATSKKSSKASSEPPLQVKWHRLRRPSTAYCPSLRSGCTMTPWANRGYGVMFGGVTDEEKGEEGLESVFHQDLNAYQWPATFTGSAAKGRWMSLTLKKPKKKGVAKKKKVQAQQQQRKANDDSDDENEDEEPDPENNETHIATPAEDDIDPDDPQLTVPIPRYNAMLAVIRNTLYLYGGILERGTREYTLDDFHYLQLDKMEKWVCLRPHSWVFGEGEESEDDSDDDSGDDDESDEDEEDYDDEGENKRDGKKDKKKQVEVVEEPEAEPEEETEPEQEPEDSLRTQAQAFMSAANTNTPENALSTPLPGETLAVFYARSREYWAQTALSTTSSDTRGKALRRDGFALAEERYEEYKPLLKEVEKILAEAGLDEEEMRRSAQAGGLGQQAGQNRNRR
ncbi:kelch domain-containing protein 4 [Moniliophthora roreri MCA 2997]|uniref:Kelch domain-containing protein 4 n=1 Tax=Moniliophthora roreri (strain MCA 2997) TaxID=1381753 RepID=V2X1G2_MONRO|nr:kelch domain-containing protein 4 [Moniliophthora roreri MCA 2997]